MSDLEGKIEKIRCDSETSETVSVHPTAKNSTQSPKDELTDADMEKELAEFKLKTTEDITKIKTTLENMEKTKEEKRWRIGIVISIIIALISSISSIIINLIEK